MIRVMRVSCEIYTGTNPKMVIYHEKKDREEGLVWKPSMNPGGGGLCRKYSTNVESKNADY